MNNFPWITLMLLIIVALGSMTVVMHVTTERIELTFNDNSLRVVSSGNLHFVQYLDDQEKWQRLGELPDWDKDFETILERLPDWTTTAEQKQLALAN